MSGIPWGAFAILVTAGFLGAVAAMPYALAMNQERLRHASLSMRQVWGVSILQHVVWVAIGAGIGLPLADQVGLRLGQGLEMRSILLSAGTGIAVALAILFLERTVFYSAIPNDVQQKLKDVAGWKRFLVCFYGGINEEILFRLFLLSLLAWLFGQIWQTTEQLPTNEAFWAANVGAALAFGAGHLPATRALTSLKPVVVLRGLVLNGIAGMVFGVLFWRIGLVAAMAAHFTADIVLYSKSQICSGNQA